MVLRQTSDSSRCMLANRSRCGSRVMESEERRGEEDGSGEVERDGGGAP